MFVLGSMNTKPLKCQTFYKDFLFGPESMNTDSLPYQYYIIIINESDTFFLALQTICFCSRHFLFWRHAKLELFQRATGCIVPHIFICCICANFPLVASPFRFLWLLSFAVVNLFNHRASTTERCRRNCVAV